jgi:hypothetical protein
MAMRKEAIAEYTEKIRIDAVNKQAETRVNEIKEGGECTSEKAQRDEKAKEDHTAILAKEHTEKTTNELTSFLLREAQYFQKPNSENKYYDLGMRLFIANHKYSFKTEIVLANFQNRVDGVNDAEQSEENKYLGDCPVYLMVYEIENNDLHLTHVIDTPNSPFHGCILSIESYMDSSRNQKLSIADHKYMCTRTYCGVILKLSLPDTDKQKSCCATLPIWLTCCF